MLRIQFPRTIYMVNSSNNYLVVQVYTVVDEMFLAGEMRETSQTKVQIYILTFFSPNYRLNSKDLPNAVFSIFPSRPKTSVGFINDKYNFSPLFKFFLYPPFPFIPISPFLSSHHFHPFPYPLFPHSILFYFRTMTII